MDFAELRARFFEALDRESGSISGCPGGRGEPCHGGCVGAEGRGTRAGKSGTSWPPGQAEYDRLRAAGVRRREAAAQVGAHERTAQDWDRGIRQIGHAHLHPDGRRINYTTGKTTIDTVGLPRATRMRHRDLADRAAGAPVAVGARTGWSRPGCLRHD